MTRILFTENLNNKTCNATCVVCTKATLTFFKLKYIAFLLKTLSKATYEDANIQRGILLDDASTIIFIDFDLLNNPYCKIFNGSTFD